jgi:hypothetical protein
VSSDAEQLVIEMSKSKSAGVGAATAHVMRMISARAGCYAPGIHDRFFFDLQRDHNGSSINSVSNWFRSNGDTLSQLGYRITARQTAFETDGMLNWVKEGVGFRGAVLVTDAAALHPDAKEQLQGAVAMTVEANGSGRDQMVLSDPWPGASSPTTASPELEAARRTLKFAALVLYWSGYA